MRKMSFTERWIKLIMVCVKTVSYSIGEPKGLIKPSHGIRQGDPIFPFLFLLCTKGLHGLISQAVRQGVLQGFSLYKNGPKLPHILFANDSLLFCRSTQKVLDILDTYSKCFGQHINKSKTTILFSKSTIEARKNISRKL